MFIILLIVLFSFNLRFRFFSNFINVFLTYFFRCLGIRVYLLLCVFVWYFNSCASWKVVAHTSQEKGLSLACVRRTWLSCAAWEANAFPQCLHLNGRSPECWRMCVRRMLEAVNACDIHKYMFILNNGNIHQQKKLL